MFEKEVIKQLVLQAIRWGAAPIITLISVKIGVTEDQTTAVIVGAIVYALMFIWGAFNKVRAEKKVEVALALPEGSTHGDIRQVLNNE